jgi:hypothetical protein
LRNPPTAIWRPREADRQPDVATLVNDRFVFMARATAVCGTGPIFRRLSDCAVSGQVPAMIEVDQDTLEEMLILVSIVLVIGVLVWKAFR